MKFKIVILILVCAPFICALAACTDREETLEGQDITSLFAYNVLSSQEQVLYKRMLEALFAHEPYIEGGLESYTFDQLSRVINFIFFDYPDIFWAESSGTIWSTEVDGVRSTT